MMVQVALALENARYFEDPFPHLELFPALDDVSFERALALLPPAEAFELRGKGLKLELDVIEGKATFDALEGSQQKSLLALRQGVRNAAARIAESFEASLRDKYVWLLGETIAADVLAAGWTTTDGRVMGRAPGYRLKPHTDSAHYGATCLLYLSDAPTPEDGAPRILPTRGDTGSARRQHVLSAEGRGNRAVARQDHPRAAQPVRRIRIGPVFGPWL